jgi:hypothetical protein
MDSVHKFDEMRENRDSKRSILEAQTAEINKKGNNRTKESSRQ